MTGLPPLVPPAATRAPAKRKLPAWLPWLIGLAVLVVLWLVIAQSIPAAPRPSLGPPSTPSTSTPNKSVPSTPVKPTGPS